MIDALFVLFAILQPAVAKAPPPLSAGRRVQKVQGYYAKTQKLRAEFRQEYTNTTFGRASTSDASSTSPSRQDALGLPEA
jgi:hypothetical protein